MMPTPHPNEFLARLPPTLSTYIQTHARFMHVLAGQDLDPPGQAATYVYFPGSALLALSHSMQDTVATEVMTVGHEALLIPLGLPEYQRHLHTSVLLSGTLIRFPHLELITLAQQHPKLRALLSVHTERLLCYLCQVVACFRHHSVRQQLARLLLDQDDRFPNQNIATTHAALATRLGVRREAVSAAAAMLRREGALEYHRAVIERIDRAKLLPFSCECYQTLRMLRQKKTQPQGLGPGD
jgi:CRP-like cAMP-binding protein